MVTVAPTGMLSPLMPGVSVNTGRWPLMKVVLGATVLLKVRSPPDTTLKESCAVLEPLAADTLPPPRLRP